MFTLELIADEADFHALEPEWKNLLAQSKQNQIFLTWEWTATWWRFFGEGRGLWVVTARLEGELVGVAPLCRHFRQYKKIIPYRQIHFMGSGLAAGDHLDFIRHEAYAQEVAIALTKFIQQRCKWWDVLYLEGLASDSPLIGLFRKSAKFVREQPSPCPLVEMPASWQTYEQQIGKNLRYNLRRYSKKLRAANEGKSSVKVVEMPAEVTTTLNHLFQFNKHTMAKKGKQSTFADARLRQFQHAFALACLERGLLRLLCLQMPNGEICAVVYAFRYGDTVSYYATGHDAASEWSQYGLGRHLLGELIRQSITEGVKSVDLLRGDEKYKFDWATQVAADVKLAFAIFR